MVSWFTQLQHRGAAAGAAASGGPDPVIGWPASLVRGPAGPVKDPPHLVARRRAEQRLARPWTHLNAKPFYQAGVLGQSLYPESVYAAPTDAALLDDTLKLQLN